MSEYKEETYLSRDNSQYDDDHRKHKVPYNENKAHIIDTFAEYFEDDFSDAYDKAIKDVEKNQKKFQGDYWQLVLFLMCTKFNDALLEDGIGVWNKWRKQNSDQYIHLEHVDCQGQSLNRIDLQNAFLNHAHLEESRFFDGNLRGAYFNRAYLDSAKFGSADISGACFDKIHINEETGFNDCNVDSGTLFTNTNINVARVEDSTRGKIEYAVRRNNWESWYAKKGKLRSLIFRIFWACNDYGYSLGKSFCMFFLLILYFASLYYAWGVIEYKATGLYSKNTGIISDLFILEDPVGGISNMKCSTSGTTDEGCPTIYYHNINKPNSFIRACYFSVVTMTTLGFGDIHAIEGKNSGHIILSIQVILGYIMLCNIVSMLASFLTTLSAPASIPIKSFKHKEQDIFFMIVAGVILFLIFIMLLRLVYLKQI